MHRKDVLLLLLLLHAFLALPPTNAADTWSRGQTMADTMLNMMDTMGRFSRDYMDSRDRSGDGFSQPWEFMVPGNGFPTKPENPAAYDRIRETGRPYRLPPTASAKTRLEGNWLSRGGERLMIRGSHFRLEAGQGRLLEGLLQIRGKLLALHSPRHRQTWIYEYARHEDRLALRSAQGQLLLYRRVDPRDSKQRGQWR